MIMVGCLRVMLHAAHSLTVLIEQAALPCLGDCAQIDLI